MTVDGLAVVWAYLLGETVGPRQSNSLSLAESFAPLTGSQRACECCHHLHLPLQMWCIICTRLHPSYQ